MTCPTNEATYRKAHWCQRRPEADEGSNLGTAAREDRAYLTEANATGQERNNYSWDATTGRVTVDTLDSNLLGSDSRAFERSRRRARLAYRGVRLDQRGVLR